MIIGPSRARNLRFALALEASSATIVCVKLTRRNMIALSAATMTPAARASSPPLVFAAASLKTVLDDIATQNPMRMNYAGSGVLARQIILGAPADIYISANPEWMTTVADHNRLAEPPVPILSNSLVIIGREPVPEFDMENLVGSGRIAMGFTEAVPAGQYGKAAFQSLGIWQAIERQVVQTENVRAAMALVARGEVPWGVVYKTDALADEDVHILEEFPPESYPKIIYQAGLVKGSGAQGLLSHLIGHSAFARYGFVTL